MGSDRIDTTPRRSADVEAAIERLTKLADRIEKWVTYDPDPAVFPQVARKIREELPALSSLTLRAGELDEEIEDADDALTIAHSLQGFATGHGDTLTDLVLSLSIQSRDRAQAAEAALKSSQARIAELETGLKTIGGEAREAIGFTPVDATGWAAEARSYLRSIDATSRSLLNPTPKAGRTG